MSAQSPVVAVSASLKGDEAATAATARPRLNMTSTTATGALLHLGGLHLVDTGRRDLRVVNTMMITVATAPPAPATTTVSVLE